jgi:hypothetical protein
MKIIQDEEESLDKLVVKARDDPAMLKLYREAFGNDFLKLKSRPNAARFVKAVEEVIGFDESCHFIYPHTECMDANGGFIETWFLAIAYKALGLDEKAKKTYETLKISSGSGVRGALATVIGLAYFGDFNEAQRIFEIAEHVWCKPEYIHVNTDDHLLITNYMNGVTSYVNAVYALASYAVLEIQKAKRIVKAIDETIGYSSKGLVHESLESKETPTHSSAALVLAKYCVNDDEDASFILSRIKLNMRAGKDGLWKSSPKHRPYEDYFSADSLLMAMALMRERNEDKYFT